MLARVTRAKIKSEKIDDVSRISDEEILPDMKDASGLVAFYLIADRESGDALAFTVWDSPEHEEASRKEVSRRFGMLGDALSGQPESPMVYDVISSIVPSKAATT